MSKKFYTELRNRGFMEHIDIMTKAEMDKHHEKFRQAINKLPDWRLDKKKGKDN